MIPILFGNKLYHDPLGYIFNKCLGCNQTTVFGVDRERKKFTLYLLPTFQYSAKLYMTCSHCGERFEVDEGLKTEVQANLMSKEVAKKEMQHRRLASTPHCFECHKEIADWMIYCPHCGIKLK
jgi:hypothetical protein